MKTAKELMIEWSRWLACQRNYQDAPSDYNGQRHIELNQGRDVWFLTGTWGDTPPLSRTIEIPTGKELFIVASFACVTDEVLKKPKLHPMAAGSHKPGPWKGNRTGKPLPKKKDLPIDPVDDGDLEEWAKEIHYSFNKVDLFIDGSDASASLEDIPPQAFNIDIDGTNPLGSYYGYPGIHRTATTGKAYHLEYIGSPHKIRIVSKAAEDPISGEPSYDIDVTYNIVPV